MHRLYTAGAVSTPPPIPSMPNPGYYPSNAAILDPYTGYAILEEIANVILAAGGTLDPTLVNQLNTAIDAKITAATNSNAYPIGYHGSAPPVYVSASTFTVANIRERDSSNTFNLTKTGSTTVNATTTGLNGIAQSPNLTGTVTVASGNAGVTFSASQAGLQVGDVITTAGGQARQLIAGAGTAWTAESNWGASESTVTVKRGGLAKNTFYNLYAISQAAGANTGLLLSTRNVAGGDTLVDLPSGYTLSNQLAFFINQDASANIIPFYVAQGWPSRPLIVYRVTCTQNVSTPAAGTTNILNNGSSGSFIAISASRYIPKISKLGYFHMHAISGEIAYRQTGDSSNGYSIGNGTSNGNTYAPFLVETNGSQQIDYKGVYSISTPSVYVDVLGCVVTEVP